ncbi:inter-alpha-trypsin inhibitor heavy chain H2-like [Littorina saxatilis]|uniref:Inter-alpha-trypsin inhibitor heavy chain H3-like n=2 Tax=Littorina saxatilis TaxID=31220 RepID=A0AAN9BT51_9CAEN
MELTIHNPSPSLTRSALTILLLCCCNCPLDAIKLTSPGANRLVLQVESQSRHLHSAHPQALQRHQRDVRSSVRVKKFHVTSKLSSRFATVTIESEVVNVDQSRSREISFQVQVPEAAFLSNFSMVVDGEKHEAQVQEKRTAERRYEEAKEKKQTAGHVKQSSLPVERGMELFTISVNLAPRGTAVFTLVYNELLERRRGTYRQRLVIQPGSIVANMSVHVSFAERQGFKSFAYKLPGSDTELTSSSPRDGTEVRARPDSRELIFCPTVEMQRGFDVQGGIHGEVVVLYSLQDEPQGGSVIVEDDYFAHFFAPPGLDPLPKNILFVIDISGSMSGAKIKQAQQALLKILDDLRDRDTFNILLFNSGVEVWAESPRSTLSVEIEKAKRFVKYELVANGATNIHLALTRGLEVLLKNSEQNSRKTADIIVFLTDGEPTSGIVDTNQIVRDVTTKNGGRSSIFSLGFGFDLNFDLITQVSDVNRGFARRVYADNDAEEQLTTFYEEISTPTLRDVVATYSSDVVDTPLLTDTTFPLFFQGREIIVAGRTKMAGGTGLVSLGAALHATGAEGAVDFAVPAGKVEVLSQAGEEDGVTERLWAYMKIKSLLKKMDMTSSVAEKTRTREQALRMALTHGFVTPLTSFSLVVDINQSHHAQDDRWSAWTTPRPQRAYSPPSRAYSPPPRAYPPRSRPYQPPPRAYSPPPRVFDYKVNNARRDNGYDHADDGSVLLQPSLDVGYTPRSAPADFVVILESMPSIVWLLGGVTMAILLIVLAITGIVCCLHKPK